MEKLGGGVDGGKTAKAKFSKKLVYKHVRFVFYVFIVVFLLKVQFYNHLCQAFTYACSVYNKLTIFFKYIINNFNTPQKIVWYCFGWYCFCLKHFVRRFQHFISLLNVLHSIYVSKYLDFDQSTWTDVNKENKPKQRWRKFEFLNQN